MDRSFRLRLRGCLLIVLQSCSWSNRCSLFQQKMCNPGSKSKTFDCSNDLSEFDYDDDDDDDHDDEDDHGDDDDEDDNEEEEEDDL